MKKIRKIIVSLICSFFTFFMIPEEGTIAKNMANNECQAIYQLVLDEVYNGTEQVIICSDSEDATLETFLNMMFKGKKSNKIEEWFSKTICQDAKKDFFSQDKISFKENKEINDFLKGEESIGKNIFYFTPVGFKNNEEALVGIGIVKNTNIINKSSIIEGDTIKTTGYLAYLKKTKSIWQIKLFVRAWG